ncbi:hypothetical protein F10086_109 [Staphylococcus phage vB_SauM_JDF86]|nr:hypothetical protein F10086_109 [Staphylococcus phage vB_SauM_JDF86]
MAMQMQSSLGSNLKKTDSDDFKINTLTYGTITKVNYQYSTVEVRTNRTYAGRVNGTDGQYSIPFPRGFTGRTPEGRPFGSTPLIIPGMLVLLGFIEGESGNPIVLSIYSNPEDSKMLTPNPLESGDIRNDDIYTYGSMMFSIFPSLNYSFQNGNGTIVRSLNGNSFLSITSEDDEKPMATDFGIGTEYEDLMSSKYGNGEIIESRNQRAPDMLFKHQGDLNTNNHITMLQLTEQGTLRFSVLNTETNSRTSWEIDDQGNQRTLSQKDDLILDNGQDYVEYGIDKEQNNFYIKNGNHDLRFTDQGLLLDGKPMIDDIGNQIDEQLSKLKEIQESLKDVNDLLDGAGKQNLLEVIDASERSEQRSKSALEQVTGLNTQVQQVSSRVEGNITNLNNFMSNINEYVQTNDEIIQELLTFKDDLNVDSIPEIKQTEEKYRHTTFRDIKIHADLPFKFNGYDNLTLTNNVSYYYPQGLAVDDDYYYFIHDTPELVNRLLVVYDKKFNFVAKYYIGFHGGENIHVEKEGDKRYLYAKTVVGKIGKFDISNINYTEETKELLPEKEYNVILYTNFFRTKEGWGFEGNNNSKGGYLQRDTVVFYNHDFSRITGSLWISPSNSTLWSNDLLGSITNYSAKKQGMALVNNTIVQTLGGNYMLSRDKEIHNYHLQGVQEISPSGDIMNDYTYNPEELIDYLRSLGKNPSVIEHESAFTYNNRLFSIIVYVKASSSEAKNKGILVVEYKPKEKDYTFNKKGIPFTAPTAKYNPYKPNINGNIYNEYTGEKLDSIKKVIKYLKETYQDKVIVYTSEIEMKDYNENKYGSGLKITIENLNNYTFFINIKDNVSNYNENYVVTYSGSGEYSLTNTQVDKRFTGLDLLNVENSLEGYSISTKGIPSGISTSGWVKVRVNYTVRRVEYKPYNESNIYVNTAYNDVWNGWEKISSNIEEQIKNLNNTGIVVSKEEPQEAMIWFEVTD